ncbi:DUF1593 domain-containing protein [Rhodopirellula bahusiensis]|uniref:DUF1593 domain-containing protein n=1 Tax=Rhodopirellula bahusiensis TaxID=2014065 RepID=UPI0032661AD6
MNQSTLSRVFAILLVFGLSSQTQAEQLKPRMLVLTDVSTWETDDHESLIRLMAHADLFEIEGIVISTGYSVKTLNKSPENGFIDIARGVVDAYEKDLPNLMKRSGQTGHEHDGGKQAIGYWPSVQYLRERIMLGSMNRGKKFIGDYNGSPGSELLIAQADEEDDRPLWIGIWGGGNTLAQSIYQVQKNRSAEEAKTFLNKLRAYAITDQDRNYKGEGLEVSSHGWIYEQTADDLLFIWDEAAWKGHNSIGKSNWGEYAKHIQGHGNLGSQYPKYKFGVEGDTPAFLYLMPNGLNDPEDPTQSSWGGNFVKKDGGLWREASTCASNFEQTYPAAFNNFAARMDWAKEGKGNRNPNLVLDGDAGLNVLRKTPGPGTSVTLDASKTTDPDGDNLQFKWWVQSDAGTYEGEIEIADSTSSAATIQIPADAAGRSFHVICEVTDDGTHNLSSYRRVVFQPTGDMVATTNQKNTSLADWLRTYIPDAYPGTDIVAHGGGAWFQAKLDEPKLIVSWANWKEEVLSLKDVEAHSLTEGESIFVDKTEASDWADHANVTFYDGVGYYIDGYEASAMSGWDVAKSTIIQFTGESDTFVAEMAEAKAEGSFTAPVPKSVDKQSDDTKLADWLKNYIPEKHADAEVIAHGGGAWFQAKITEPNLIVSWADWKEEILSLKDVEAHSLTEGESIFVDKTEASDWADHANVTFYEGVGYYIDGYEASAMSGWDVAKSTIIQFTGDSDTFVAEMAEAKADSSAAAPKPAPAKESVSFKQWLYEYLPTQYPNAEMIDHTYWLQGKIGNGISVNWTEWTDNDSTLKAMEAHNLTAGKSMFIEQKGNKKQDWADNPNVTYYEGAGYYISGYDPATMGEWDGKGLSVIQFDGDSSGVAKTIAEGWSGDAKSTPVPSKASQTKEPSGEPSAGTPYSPFPSNVVVTKVKHFDNMCWKIAAAGGTWYFENGETGGKTGFSSAFDQAGNDWIGNDADRGYNKSSASGGRHEYRGWPNFGNGNFNHPQRSSGSKSWWVDASGNAVAFDEKLEGDHLIMRSSNAKYDVEYHFFPSHAAIKVLKAADKYAFLYEGSIGGEQDASVEKDFYVLKDGKHRECKEGGLGYLESEFGNKFPSPFFYLEDSDPKDTQVWYAGVKNAGPESAGDEGWRQGSNMVIFSFGRDEDKRAYTGTDAVCVFGFQPKGSHEHIASFIESRLESPFAAPSAKANPAPANAGASSASGSTYTKPRMIVTTDLGADPDDEQSLVRMLVCANEFDIEGLVVSTGCWKKKQSNTNMLDKIVDAYGECYDNLKVHAEGFPTPEYLRSISVMGQLGYGMSDVGDGKDSLGSDMIIASADRDDPRPIWVGGWGGTNNVAQAIWTVSKTRSKEDLEKFLAKLRVYDILGQDDAGAWIAKNYPQVFYIRATKVYGWQPPKNGDYQKKDIQSHGPLGALYPDTKWATEGDTPAYMHIYPTGLNDPDQIDQGGWGGRFSFKKKTGIKSMSGVKGEERKFDPYEMWGNTSDGTGAIKRWSKGYNNDFAARMDWSITSKFSEANHHPVAILNGNTTRDVLGLSVASGESVSLSAAGTNDPDNDSLTYSWSIYEEPATYKGAVAINGPSDPTARISVPADASGKNIHVILEVHDDGTPNLYAYRRMILNVK